MASHEGSKAVILSLESSYAPEIVEMHSLESISSLSEDLDQLNDWEDLYHRQNVTNNTENNNESEKLAKSIFQEMACGYDQEFVRKYEPHDDDYIIT